MRVSAWTSVIVLAILIALNSHPSQAQGNFGSVTGTVMDQRGAAVPNCHLTVENLATGLRHSPTFTSAGVYLIPNLPNGEYRLIATAPAFKTLRQEPVIVFTPTATTVDVSLTLGQVASSQALPLFGGANRPIRVEGVPLRTQSDNFNPRTDRWLNPAAFIDPAPFTFGTLGRTVPNLRGPWFANENAGLAKEVRLRERHTIELRATPLNAFNRVVFNNPSATVGAANFGMFSSQKNLPREVELQGRYTF